jgi:hypothetical protein
MYRYKYIIIFIFILFIILYFTSINNNREYLDLSQNISLGCYQKVNGIGITPEHAINSYGILQNPDLDAQFKIRMLKNVQFTETEDPIFYNLLYDSDIKPPEKVMSIYDIISNLIKPCSENIDNI